MDTAAAQPFQPPVIPWRQPRKLERLVDLGPGVDPQVCGQALARLCSEPDVLAVLAFGSRARGDAHADSDLDLAVICQDAELTPEGKLAGWRRYRERLGYLTVGVDLIVTGWRQAEKMAGSRWHVMGDVAREGKVLYVAG